MINIDCDLYSSAKQALDFCAPLIKDSSVIFFDDWTEEYVGEKKAFDEFLKENSNFLTEEIGTYKPAGKIFLVQRSWESKLLLEVGMERISGKYFGRIDFEDVYPIVGFHGAIMIIFLTLQALRFRREDAATSSFFNLLLRHENILQLINDLVAT